MTLDSVRDRILRGHFPEGEPLRQDAIADELGVSRIPVREALRQLESEGLVERCVHAGTPPRVSYALTEKGTALRPAIRELRAWAQRWNGTGS
jgi:DNA-binding HxlR family transcriptional regulator